MKKKKTHTDLLRSLLGGLCLAFALFFFSSCSALKKIPQDQSLLVANRVSIKQSPNKPNTDKRISRNNIKNLLSQEPNSKFLGMRLKLALYNPEKKKQRGEPPAIFDSLAIETSKKRISQYLANKGYFSPEIEHKTKFKGKEKRKVEVKYSIFLNDVYTIDTVIDRIRDEEIAKLLQDRQKNSLFSPGEPYDVENLNKERDRITRIVRNNGYFAFSKDYISYTIDSALSSNKMKITLNLRRTRNTAQPHTKYTINDIYINQIQGKYIGRDSLGRDTIIFVESKKNKKNKILNPYNIVYLGDRPVIKPKYVSRKVFIDKDSLFSVDKLERTYEALGAYRILSFSDIRMVERADSGKIDCVISLIEGKKFAFSAEGELTTSSGFMPGIAANVGFVSKNIFRGGEVFNLKLRGMYELQMALGGGEDNKSLLNTYELKAEIGIDIPRPVFLNIEEKWKRFQRANTSFLVSYSYQNKTEYSRGIFNASWAYSGKRSNIYHYFNPIEINVVNMLKQSEWFRNYLNSLNRNRLKYQYEDHFILDWKYVLVYNEQNLASERDFNYLRFGVETAGNLLYGISKAFGLQKNEQGQYQMFSLAFSQYVRFELDYKHYFVFKKNVHLVFRSMFGLGVSYANSKSLPFEKAFYTGGSMGLRAWPLYKVGPGSYANQENSTFERLGDILFLINLEQRFPIYGGLRGAVFADLGNIWLRTKNSIYEGGEFAFNRFYKELALGTGVGLRYDFGFFVIRVDLGIPLRDPSIKGSDTWVIKNLKFNDLMLNFGIGYPF